MVPPREQDIQTFFEAYGPSARDCLRWCSDLESYDRAIRGRISGTSWDTLTAALSNGVCQWPGGISFEDGSHKVILVAPLPEEPFLARVTVVTKYVNQLLWDKDAITHRQNLRQLYRTVQGTLSLVPDTKGSTGLLFEPGFHQLCMKGKKAFTLHAMTKSSTEPVNYIFKNSKSTSSDVLQLHPRELFSFNRIPGLDTKKYYRPTIPNYPFYDAFIYDQGTDLRRVTVFQIANGTIHDVKSRGLRTLLGELGANDIWFVIVTFVDCEVTCSVEKTMYDELKPKMYFLEVDEGDLFDE
jgi:hypothetical protein